MLLADGGSLWNCRRQARWRETADSWFANCSTKNAFSSGVAIFFCNVTDRKRERKRERGLGLRMRSELEYLRFRSTWETYLCVHIQSRYGRLKPLQSFWYTLYNILNVSLLSVSSHCFVCIYYLSYVFYLPHPSLLFLHFIILKLYLVNNKPTKSKAPYYAVFFSLLLAYFLLELNILLSTRFSNTLIRIISLGWETKF
jgi:hypothetical protein